METQIQQHADNIVSTDVIRSLILDGDVSKMTANQKVEYVTNLSKSLGLNPLSQPFQIIRFQSKEKLYATKDCTEQLRKIHGVSVTESISERHDELLIVHVKVQDKTGRTDVGTGAVVIGNVKGEALANAYMKCETKAKRRATLSICGLGMLDESELDTMPPHVTTPVEWTGEQITQIEQLKATSNLSEEKLNTLEERLSEGMTYSDAEKCINWLKQNQINLQSQSKTN